MIYLIKNYKKKTSDQNSWYPYLSDILKNDYNQNFDELDISYNEYGKPLLGAVHFSVTHTDHELAIVISDNEVGIDMEEVRKYEPLVAKKLFTDKEQALVKDNDYLFTRVFVMKEAYGKYDGRGLGEYLKEIEVGEIDNLETFDYDNLIMAVCNSNNNEIKEL